MATTPVKGPRLLISISVLVLGVLLAIAGVVGFATSVWRVLDGPSYATPGTVRLHLDTGTYIVFDRAVFRLDPSDVTVTDPAGNELAVSSSTPNETITRGSESYVAAVEFDVDRAGRYTLRFQTSSASRVIVEHPLGDLFRRNVPWLLAILFGGLLAVGGMVLLIVGIVRRGREKRAVTIANAAPATAPAAWYPDPHGQHRLRYWDGATWTDHTAD